MAKSKPNRSPSDADAKREAERQQALRELGLDELTYEACARELFEELIGPVSSTVGPARPEPVRVVQAGPGRRS
jgi:hypothetical protein